MSTRSLMRTLALTLPLIVPISTAAQNVRDGISFRVHKYMRAQMRIHHFSGSVLMARRGKMITSKGYGMANLELGVLNSRQSKFRIGSITEQFTAAAILQLKDDTKLALSDSICKYVPDCPAHWQPIKIVHLLTHTSGIRSIREFPDYPKLSVCPDGISELLLRLKNESPEFLPGEKFKDGSSEYLILGRVIESMAGIPYSTYVEQRILQPLEMHDTGYDRAARILPKRATGYVWQQDKAANAPYVDLSGQFSEAGLYSTVDDLYRWDRAFHEAKLLSSESRREMFSPYRDGFGFGWKVVKEFGRQVLTRNTEVTGFSASIRRFPDDDAFVVVLSNMEGIDANRICHDLAAILFGEHYELPAEQHPPT